MKDYLLVTIRREGPISAAVLKSDLRTMARNGVAMGEITDHAIQRVLCELESEGLIERTADEWVAVREKLKPAKAKQTTMF